MSFFSTRLITSGSYISAPQDHEAKQHEIQRLREALNRCDGILVGAGAGLSTAAGLTYSGKRFSKHFGDFRSRFGITDMYSGGFFPFPDIETYWAWWSRQIWINRYDAEIGKPYLYLLELVQDKDYFVLTTNVDHQFQRAGFDKQRLFYTQGDYGLFQCSRACTNETYDNQEIIQAMYTQQKDMRIPHELIPRCPHCKSLMTTNLRVDDTFVEDAGWHAAEQRYENFRRKHRFDSVVYLELGVGNNTPVIIKYPFWNMTYDNRNATYACINLGEATAPEPIASQSILIDGDIAQILDQL